MKTFTFGIAILHLASLSYAAPGSAPLEARQGFESNVTFQGAGPNPPSYSLHVPYDGTTFKINNPLSVSHIIADNTNSGVCTFFGVDGSVTVLSGETTAEVGPPQQLVSGSCVRFTAVRPRSEFQVGITFIGAGPDPPTCFQLFPTDDNSYAIVCTLSVSQIRSIGGGFCSFRGVDGSVTVVAGEGTVDVGPPQVLVSGTCDVL